MCKLCEGAFDFRKVLIKDIVGSNEIVFSGNLKQCDNLNCFKFCPECGKELSSRNFGGLLDIKTPREVVIGGVYEHFKRDESCTSEDNTYRYIVKGIAQHSETLEDMVIYQALYPPFKTYTRPKDMFLSKVDRTKYPDSFREYRMTYTGLCCDND